MACEYRLTARHLILRKLMASETKEDPSVHTMESTILDDGRRCALPLSSANCSSSRLLALPWEIRNSILHELLHKDAPLDSAPLGMALTDWPISESDRLDDWLSLCKRNFSFTPAILRVCQQLYTEGSLIIQSNTVKVTAWAQRTSSMGAFRPELRTRINFLGYDLQLDWIRHDKIPRCYVPLLSRVHIIFTCEDGDQNMDRDEVRKYLEQAAATLDRSFFDEVEFDKVTIEIHANDHGLDLENRLDILCTFRELQWCRELDLSGCGIRLELEEFVYRFHRLLVPLGKFVIRDGDRDYRMNEALGTAHNCIRSDDVAGFKEQRRIMTDRATAILNEDIEEVMSNDTRMEPGSLLSGDRGLH